jgi:hypothetical protein
MTPQTPCQMGRVWINLPSIRYREMSHQLVKIHDMKRVTIRCLR